jgi:hypothetical protein
MRRRDEDFHAYDLGNTTDVFTLDPRTIGLSVHKSF